MPSKEENRSMSKMSKKKNVSKKERQKKVKHAHNFTSTKIES